MMAQNRDDEGKKRHIPSPVDGVGRKLSEGHSKIYTIIIITAIVSLISIAGYLAHDILSHATSGHLAVTIGDYNDSSLQEEDYWMDKGTHLEESGTYQDAIECFDNVINLNSSSSLAWRHKGIAFYALGSFKEALICFNQSLMLAPFDAISWYYKGMALDHLGRTAVALDCFDNATAQSPEFGDAWYACGVALSNLGRQEEAVYCYDRALGTVQKPTSDIWRNKGSAIASMGRYEKALRCYNNALALNSSDSEAWYYKGLVLGSLGRDTEANEAFMQSEKLGGQQSPTDASSSLLSGKAANSTNNDRRNNGGSPIPSLAEVGWNGSSEVGMAAGGAFEENTSFETDASGDESQPTEPNSFSLEALDNASTQ